MGRRYYKQTDEKPVFRHYYIPIALKRNIDFLTNVFGIGNTEFVVRAYEYYKCNPYVEASTLRKGEGYIAKGWMWQVYVLPSIIEYAKEIAAEYNCEYSKVIYQMLLNYTQVCNQALGIDMGAFYEQRKFRGNK